MINKQRDEYTIRVCIVVFLTYLFSNRNIIVLFSSAWGCGSFSLPYQRPKRINNRDQPIAQSGSPTHHIEYKLLDSDPDHPDHQFIPETPGSTPDSMQEIHIQTVLSHLFFGRGLIC